MPHGMQILCIYHRRTDQMSSPVRNAGSDIQDTGSDRRKSFQCCGHHCIVYQYRKLVCFRCCGISCNCCSTFLARPDFICGEYGSDVERRCFRPFLQNSAVPCILLTSESSCTRTVIQKLNETEALFDQKTLCYELKIKGLLCEIFGMILCEHQNDFAKFIPAN